MLLDSTAVAENRIAGGVGEKTGAIPFSRPDHRSLLISIALLCMYALLVLFLKKCYMHVNILVFFNIQHILQWFRR